MAFAGQGLTPVAVQAAADKVTICHFPGHGDPSIKGSGDYITSPKDLGGCEKRGGNLISISVNALPAHGLNDKCDPSQEKCL